jgi:HlyD family secretion protein
MKKRRILIAAIVVVVGIAIYLVSSLGNHGDDGSMLLSGNVEITETNVGFKIPGRVIEIPVDEGSVVKEGDVLARLDGAELFSVVAQNRASMQEASARLSELKEGSRTQEIEQAKSNVIAQEAELQRVKQDYERADVLYKNGAISKAQFDTAKSAYDVRTAMHKSAQEALSLAREGARKGDIKIGEYRVEQAKAMLAATETRAKDTIIYAPIAGVVLRKNVEVGETVGQGIPVFTIGDLKSPWIKVYVKETKILQIKLGQKAQISVDRDKDKKTYEGVVSYISQEAEFTPKTVQTPEERVKLVFGVKIRIKNENDELKPGMPADVKIVLTP